MAGADVVRPLSGARGYRTPTRDTLIRSEPPMVSCMFRDGGSIFPTGYYADLISVPAGEGLSYLAFTAIGPVCISIVPGNDKAVRSTSVASF